MLFLDGVCVEGPDGPLRLRWVKTPPSAELAHLTQTVARRIARHVDRQRLLERDVENSYLAGDALEAGLLENLLGSSPTYRIAVGPHQGRKVFTLQKLPACDEPFDDGVGKVTGFSLHAGKPTQSAFIERFNRTVRHEWLDEHLFESIEHAQQAASECSGATMANLRTWPSAASPLPKCWQAPHEVYF